ncbi:MAG: ribonuclease P protein component [Rhodothermus sp.]|nr:ribonuclease P protein component [Rhodothermus sp.]
MEAPQRHGTSEGGPRGTNRLPRAFRLRRQRLIRPLFDRSRTDVGTVAKGCVRLLYRVVLRDEVGEDVPVQVGFTAGRQARRSVVRNRIRRLLRETYRLHQHPLVALFRDRPDTLTLMILYRADPARARECIRRDLPEALKRLTEQLRKKLLEG